MATGYTRIGKMLIPYEKPDPETKKSPSASFEPPKEKTILEKAAEAVEEVVKPKRRGRKPKASAD